MRVVLDTNILVRAAGDEQGLAGRLLQEIVSGSHVLEVAVAEYCAGQGIKVLDDIELYHTLTGRPMGVPFSSSRRTRSPL